jgi:hypothetical protein
MKKTPQQQPDPIQQLGLHAAFGGAVGIVIASLLVLANAGGLKDLLLATGEPFVPLLVFELCFASIFATIEVSFAISSAASDK